MSSNFIKRVLKPQEKGAKYGKSKRVKVRKRVTR